MMVEGHKMDVVYYDPYPAKFLEDYVTGYGTKPPQLHFLLHTCIYGKFVRLSHRAAAKSWWRGASNASSRMVS